MPPTPFLPNSYNEHQVPVMDPPQGPETKLPRMGCQHMFTTHAQNYFIATESAGRAHTVTPFITKSRDEHRLQVIKWLRGTKERRTCIETTFPNVVTGNFSLLIMEGLAMGHSSILCNAAIMDTGTSGWPNFIKQHQPQTQVNLVIINAIPY